ncbi:MAG: hypothetical protein QM778_21560 [Myxococcales bacterium]
MSKPTDPVEPEFAFTDAVVDQVLRGERVLPFLPGTRNAVGAMLLVLLGTTCLVGSVGLSAAQQRSDAQLVGVGAVALGALAVNALGFCLVQGLDRAQTWFLRWSTLGFVASLGTALTRALGDGQGPLLPAATAASLFLGALAVQRSEGFITHAHFRRRLRAGRARLAKARQS